MKSVILATSGMRIRGFEMREVNRVVCVDRRDIAIQEEEDGILIIGAPECLYKVLYEITMVFANVTIN